MQISIKKDLSIKLFRDIDVGTVFRHPYDCETFYMKVKKADDYGAVELTSGTYYKNSNDADVIPYYDAELIIQ